MPRRASGTPNNWSLSTASSTATVTLALAFSCVCGAHGERAERRLRSVRRRNQPPQSGSQNKNHAAIFVSGRQEVKGRTRFCRKTWVRGRYLVPRPVSNQAVASMLGLAACNRKH